MGKNKDLIGGKKSSKLLKTKGTQVIPWKLHNPSIYRGAHRTPIVAMEKSAYGKTRMKKRTQLVPP